MTVFGIYFRFSIQRFVAESSRGKKARKDKTEGVPARVALPVSTRFFSRGLDWSNLWNLGKLEFRNVIRDSYFISIMLGAVIFLFLDDWIGNLNYGAPDQIAVAPGYLQREWTEGNRHYFHYKQDSKTDYFFTLVSARYEVLRDTWTAPDGKVVNIEIFHHPEHAYNLDRFVAALKDGMGYFYKNFGPYQFRQVRILEFPRYAVFAQSFPNTIPYSEDSWMKITLYENRILTAKSRKTGDNQYEVTLQVKARKLYADEKGRESEATNMNDYIDIGIFTEDKVEENGRKLTQPLYLRKHRLTNGEHTIVLTVTGKPVRAGIDPYNKLIDRVPEDNRVEFN